MALLVAFGGCTQPGILCEKPYMEVNGECCLDADDNSICDSNEVTTNITTTTTATFITTITTIAITTHITTGTRVTTTTLAVEGKKIDLPENEIVLAKSEIMFMLDEYWRMDFYDREGGREYKLKEKVSEVDDYGNSAWGLDGKMVSRVIKMSTQEQARNALLRLCNISVEEMNSEETDIGDVGYICTYEKNLDWGNGSFLGQGYIIAFARYNVISYFEYETVITHCDSKGGNCRGREQLNGYYDRRDEINAYTRPKLIEIAVKQDRKIVELSNH